MFEKLDVTILFGINATKLSGYDGLKDKSFDRIIFNAPHCGTFGKELDLINIECAIWDGNGSGLGRV
ncbi:hypothetical protein HanPI659440_Chr01g0016841 [Helianthus annuus]|nr:hypothetical protein HanPI659440_Chr01g0016841 [Helianthus annuus]